MSEEEIIKRLKNIIEINKSFLDCNIKENSNIYKDIQGLLDLYNKEKEKNEELLNEKLEVKISVSAHNQIRQLQNELQQEKEKNKELKKILKERFGYLYE